MQQKQKEPLSALQIIKRLDTMPIIIFAKYWSIMCIISTGKTVQEIFSAIKQSQLTLWETPPI